MRKRADQATDPELDARLSDPVDRTSPLPYYIHVKEALRDRIERGLLRPGDQLPAEQDLCQMFDVSRTVVRQALQELRYAGLVVREKGRGTFIAEPKIPEGLFQRLTGFYEDMVARGHVPVNQVLRQERILASQAVAERLHLEVGASVIRIDRLRFVRAEPIVLVSSYLPYALCPGLLNEDLTRTSLYSCLEHSYGLVIVRGHRSLEAVQASEEQARMLHVAAGAPLIKLESVGYLHDGTPLEYYHSLHRGDRSRFDVELIRVSEIDKAEVTVTEHVISVSLPPGHALTDPGDVGVIDDMGHVSDARDL